MAESYPNSRPKLWAAGGALGLSCSFENWVFWKVARVDLKGQRIGKPHDCRVLSM
jgi:hypothetical protein